METERKGEKNRRNNMVEEKNEKQRKNANLIFLTNTDSL